METVVKADWFFFITSIAVVVLSLLFAVVLVMLIRILRDVQHMVKIAKEEIASIREDIGEIREDMKEQYEKTKAFAGGVVHSLSLGNVLSFLVKSVTEAGAKRRRSSSKKKGKNQEG